MNFFTPFADRKRRPKPCRCGGLFIALALSWAVAAGAIVSLASQTWHAAEGFRHLATLTAGSQP